MYEENLYATICIHYKRTKFCTFQTALDSVGLFQDCCIQWEVNGTIALPLSERGTGIGHVNLVNMKYKSLQCFGFVIYNHIIRNIPILFCFRYYSTYQRMSLLFVFNFSLILLFKNLCTRLVHQSFLYCYMESRGERYKRGTQTFKCPLSRKTKQCVML